MNYIQVKPLEGCPALAGIDRKAIRVRAFVAWLPRTRGDRPLYSEHNEFVQEAAPHSRG